MPNSADEAVLLAETVGHVRVLRLNRPERKNALSDELGWRISNAVEEAARDDAIRVIAITGTGNAFCSGVDLVGVASEHDANPLTPSEAPIDDLLWIGRFPLTFRLGCDKPIVAGINGVAVGAGLSLAMCADIRIASSTARFHPGYARAGTSPDGGLSWTLPSAVGHERAMRFLLELRMVDAVEAERIGLVGEVVEESAFEDRLLAYCEQLSQVAPLAVRQSKRMLMRAQLATDLEAHMREELVYARRGLDTEDGREAISALLEKRKPEFNGR